MFIPVPQVSAAKAIIMPALGFLFPYLKHLAQMGINIMKLMSPIMLASIIINERTNVTLNLLDFLVSNVKNASKNPLLSIIPNPMRIINILISGAKLAKFDTVVLKIILSPERFKRDVTMTVVVSKSPLKELTEL